MITGTEVGMLCIDCLPTHGHKSKVNDRTHAREIILSRISFKSINNINTNLPNNFSVFTRVQRKMAKSDRKIHKNTSLSHQLFTPTR